MHKITEAILQWYDINKRSLPWRDFVTPYRTLVSEVMLQQTRVTTVIPYFEEFLRVFPDAQTLSQAPQDQVLAKWSGLGYYSRAKNLHKCAIEISKKYKKKFPENPDVHIKTIELTIDEAANKILKKIII